MRYILGTELSERETYMIGSIVSQWGFLETEIFEQTILSFENGENLPDLLKKNAQFSTVLKLWMERVVEVQDAAKKELLTEKYEKILALNEFRQAVVHSRWECHPGSPEEIAAIRIHKKSIKRVKFTFSDLADFARALGEIRYWIRFPGGSQDRAEEMAKGGGYMSRDGWESLLGHAKSDDVTNRGENK